MDFIPSKYISWVIIFIIIYASSRLFKSQSGLLKFLAGILLLAVSLSAFSNVSSGPILWILALALAYRDLFVEWCWNIAGFTRSIFSSISNSGYFSFKVENAPERENPYYERESHSNTSSEELKEAQREAQSARAEAERARQEARIAKEQAQKAQAQTRTASSTSPPDNRTSYEILEVRPDASKEEIRRAHKKQSQKYHPDRNPEHLKKAMEAEFKLIQKAYKALG